MTKTHFSNLILAAVFSTAMAAPAIASASVPVNAGSSARAARGTLVAAVTSDEKKDEKKSDKKDKASADKSKKEKAPAPAGGGW